MTFGILIACQISINGHLGLIQSSVQIASTYSFLSGSIILWIIYLLTPKTHGKISNAIRSPKKYWWIWLGGILGALYVLGASSLVEQIGAGQVVVFSLFGQLLASAIIEQYGLLESTKRKVHLKKIIGLVVLFVGVILTGKL